MVEGGFFGKRKGLGQLTWQQELENEFMEKCGLVYFDDEKKMKRVGCIARLATRMRNNINKNMQVKGKKKHGQIFTRRSETGARKVRGRGSTAVADVIVRDSEKLESYRKGGITVEKKKRRKKQ